MDTPYRLTPHANGLLLEVNGHFDEASGRSCCEAIGRHLEAETLPELIVDINRMQGYARGTRLAFQEVLLGNRERIGVITLITTNPLFRMASSAVCIHARVKMRFCPTVEAALQSAADVGVSASSLAKESAATGSAAGRLLR